VLDTRVDSKADRLRAARIGSGFAKAAEAAKRFGWSYPTYAGHENGHRGFTPSTAQDYAQAFCVAPEWLLFGEHRPNSENERLSVAIERLTPEQRQTLLKLIDSFCPPAQ